VQLQTSALKKFEPRNVLITRLSAIGDCIATIPLAVRAKQLWPNCKLSWIVDCAASQLLEAHTAIDEIIRIERHWLKRPAEWPALRRELKVRQFDCVLDPQGLTKSALIGWLSGAKVRVGLDYSHGREIGPLLATRRVRRQSRHVVDTYLRLLSPWCETPPGEGEYAMPIYGPAAKVADRILADLGWQNSQWVALNPGAGWTTRVWPVQRFGMLAREILRETGRRSLVTWGNESERLLAGVIEEVSQGAALPAPRTSLTEMFELLRRASLIVTVDTSALHMASALSQACVSLHGPTWSDETGPYNTRHISIQSPQPPLSKRAIRHGPNTSMQAIELNEVLHGCLRMFELESAHDQAAA
jgi:lipopolysaccharide heptosyltransferase I